MNSKPNTDQQLATVSLYLVTEDPTAFLFLIGNGFGVYFIVFLIKTRAQWRHGWAAFIFGLGFLAWPWTIINARNGTPNSWWGIAGITAAIGVIGLALAPTLGKLEATPRLYGEG